MLAALSAAPPESRRTSAHVFHSFLRNEGRATYASLSKSNGVCHPSSISQACRMEHVESRAAGTKLREDALHNGVKQRDARKSKRPQKPETQKPQT